MKSRTGRERVDQVASVIRTITGDPDRIKQLVDDIYEGSQEQLKGIDQVASSIQQIEKVTQSSAASAEECATASQELASQSEAIGRIVDALNCLVGGLERQSSKVVGSPRIQLRAGHLSVP